MDPQTRRKIARGYYGQIAFIVCFIVFSALMSIANGEDGKLEAPVYFAALAWLIHAHGNRLRDTTLALHGEKL